MSTTSTPEIPERFRVAKPTLMLDRFMTHFIKGGGFAIIAAVFLIFVFIGIQVILLFRGASVDEEAVYDIPSDDIAVFGIDEYGELPFFVSSDGELYFLDTRPEDQPGHRGWFGMDIGLPQRFRLWNTTSVAMNCSLEPKTASSKWRRLSMESPIREKGGDW